MFISLAFVCFLFSLQEPDNLSSEIEVHEETRPSESSQAASSQMHLVHSARMHACTRMHACMHAHTHARMHACTRAHTHTHTHTHTHARERERRERVIFQVVCAIHIITIVFLFLLSLPIIISTIKTKQTQKSTQDYSST